jgi:hypothetical protein
MMAIVLTPSALARIGNTAAPVAKSVAIVNVLRVIDIPSSSLLRLRSPTSPEAIVPAERTISSTRIQT